MRLALKIRQETLGVQHPDVAQPLNNLANLAQTTGRYTVAVPLHEQANAILRHALGAEHPHVAQSLNNLAWLHYEMGDYVAAESLHRQALATRQNALGANHPDVAQSLHNLAWLCAATERQDEALALLQTAMAIDDRMIGQVFSIGSENQRMAYLERARGGVYSFLSPRATSVAPPSQLRVCPPRPADMRQHTGLRSPALPGGSLGRSDRVRYRS